MPTCPAAEKLGKLSGVMKGGLVGGDKAGPVPNVTCLGMAPRKAEVTLAGEGEATVGVGGAETGGGAAAADDVGVGRNGAAFALIVVETVGAVVSSVVAARVSVGTIATLAPAGMEAALESVGEPGSGSASAGRDATKALVL